MAISFLRWKKEKKADEKNEVNLSSIRNDQNNRSFRKEECLRIESGNLYQVQRTVKKRIFVSSECKQ